MKAELMKQYGTTTERLSWLTVFSNSFPLLPGLTLPSYFDMSV
jgi:hypothetical protein